MPDPLRDRLARALEGRYDIQRRLGEGGMATVWLARDVKHDRPVAVKVLKPELAAVVGAERFLAEIETTAGLSHPHILPLHDSGEAEGFLFFVTPYVDGETLRERLDGEGQLAVDEAVEIATALAGALDHAHQRDVVHRDVKPGNVLFQDGQPLLADFGIALAVGSAAGGRLTETGLSVGTPWYMSPEQAAGDPRIGPPSDVWSLGSVLYEMLVGEPPHPGPTVQAVLGRILAGGPVEPRRHRPQIPPHVDAALRRALERLPADRFRTARDFAGALKDPGFRHGGEGGEVAGSRTDGRWGAVAMVAVALAAVMGGVMGWTAARGSVERPVTRYAMELSGAQDPGEIGYLTLAPDGSRFVYGADAAAGEGTQIWIRERDALDPVPLEGTGGGGASSFSPDGTRLAFATWAGALRTISLDGGPPVTLVGDEVQPETVAWGDDDRIYFTGAETGRLHRVASSGGEPTPFTTRDRDVVELAHANPFPLPEGKGILFTVIGDPMNDTRGYRIAVADPETGAHEVLTEGVRALWSPTGHLLYVTSEGSLLARPFDPGSRTFTGEALPLGEVAVRVGRVDVSLGGDGTLAYLMGGPVRRDRFRAVWVERDGTVTPVDSAWTFDPAVPEVGVAVSPDGSRLVVKEATEAGQNLWLKELDEGPRSRLTFSEAADRRPRWTPGGDSIYWVSGPDSAGSWKVLVRSADGTGSATEVLDLGRPVLEVERSPDGRWYIVGAPFGDIVAVPAGDTTTVPLAAGPAREAALDLSPDGRWLAYESDETGVVEVYVRPFPDAAGGRWQVSTGGGTNPRWSRDGAELFYIDGQGRMTAAEIPPGEAFRVGRLTRLFDARALDLVFVQNYAGWDVAPDGRFLMVQALDPGEEEEDLRLVVVENFVEELRRRAAGRP